MNTDPQYTEKLVVGLKQHLTVGGVTAPIVFGPITQAADTCIGLTPYPVEDDQQTGDVTTGVQIRMRGSKGSGVQTLWGTQGLILGLLSSLEPLTLPNGVVVSLARREVASSAPVGLDGSGRPEILDSYYLRSDRIGLTG